jgi:hypothetical protein
VHKLFATWTKICSSGYNGLIISSEGARSWIGLVRTLVALVIGSEQAKTIGEITQAVADAMKKPFGLS